MVGVPWVLPQWDVGAASITTVVEIDTVLGPTACLAVDLVDRTSVVVAFQEEVALEGISRISLIDFCATEQNDILEVRPNVHSSWFLHRQPSDALVTDFGELCSGLGALGRGACDAGFRVVGVNELQTRKAEVAAQVTGCSVAVGDVCSNEVLVQLWNAFPREAGITAGFSCQPFSGLGDRKGRSDSRSKSLVGVLRASFLLQAPWTLLECVAPSGKDEFVVECIEGYCASLGCRWEAVELEIRDVWRANRKRWWCLITPTSRPPVQLQAWQPSGPWRSQARKPLVSFLLRSGAALPTALHSWGAQVYSCPCGCRPFPFKPSRLADKLCAVLLRVHTPEGLRFRHLTPHEAALLNGLSPETYFGHDMRLALTLVGQLASPLQSCWVLASMRIKHGSVLPGMQPAQLLWQQRLDLLAAAARCGLRCVAPATVDIPTQLDAPQEVCQVVAGSSDIEPFVRRPQAGILSVVGAEGNAQPDPCRGRSGSATRVGSPPCTAGAPIAPTEDFLWALPEVSLLCLHRYCKAVMTIFSVPSALGSLQALLEAFLKPAHQLAVVPPVLDSFPVPLQPCLCYPRRYSSAVMGLPAVPPVLDFPMARPRSSQCHSQRRSMLVKRSPEMPLSRGFPMTLPELFLHNHLFSTINPLRFRVLRLV